MTFEEWLYRQQMAGHTYGQDEQKAARSAWDAAEQAAPPHQVYHDSRVIESVVRKFAN